MIARPIDRLYDRAMANTDVVRRVPATVVSGFLGAGKTTLINQILEGNHGERCCVLVNDFGEINIDATLIRARERDVISFANGCICCSVQSDLVAQLCEILSGALNAVPDRIIIETSGLSDPRKVIHALCYPELSGKILLDATVVLVDADQFFALDERAWVIAQEQIASADIILLNKIDLADPVYLARFKQEWSFPGARIIETDHAVLPPSILFGSPAHRKDNLIFPNVDSESSDESSIVTRHQDFSTWSWCGAERFNIAKLRSALKSLPPEVYRGKGIVRIALPEKTLIAFNLVGQRVNFLPIAIGATEEFSKAVFIGRRDSMASFDFNAWLMEAVVGRASEMSS